MTIVCGQIVATACVDDNGFELTEECLRQCFETMPKRILLSDRHDCSKPPCGELFNPRLQRLDNGLLAMVADIHYFDDDAITQQHGFSIAFSNATLLHHKKFNQPVDILFSINPLFFNDTDANELFQFSCGEANIAVEHRIERGLDAPAIMLVVATFGIISRGFFNAAGADLYHLLKGKIKEFGETIKEKHGTDLSCQFKFVYEPLSNKPQFLVSVSSAAVDRLGKSGFDLQSIEETLNKFCDTGQISHASLSLNEDDSPVWTINYVRTEKGNFQTP